MKNLGEEKCSQLSFEKIRKHIWTKDLPDVDLIIRTGITNDPHLSGNLLMFQTGYSQLYFTPILWPDFTGKELTHALSIFEKNERKLGK
jgi:undecaprenyl diphosphate synthase